MPVGPVSFRAECLSWPLSSVVKSFLPVSGGLCFMSLVPCQPHIIAAGGCLARLSCAIFRHQEQHVDHQVQQLYIEMDALTRHSPQRVKRCKMLPQPCSC